MSAVLKCFEKLRLLDDPEPHGAALNMAIDEVLLRTVEAPLLRCYRWARHAVSFGYFGKVTEVERAWPARELVRRWTGGGVVPHGKDFTYSLIMPRSCPFYAIQTVDSYRQIHEALATVLLSVGEEIAFAESAAEKVSDACFENAVRHDLVSGMTKIAGAAQRRTQNGLLHQGSIQSGSPRPEFAHQFAAALAAEIEPWTMSVGLMADARLLAVEKYASSEWMRRV